VTDSPLARLRQHYLAGARPVDVVEAAYARFDGCADDAIVISEVPREQSAARARALEGQDPSMLPLYGVPFAIKDNIDVEGTETTAGCPSYAFRPERSAPVVERLCAAGAIPIVKTNMDQFATGLVGTRSPYGTARNAVDARYVPGGSSSGSAVSVARGLVPFALGTDTAGSGRVPAAFNGIVGFKSTRGLISTGGVVPAVRSIDCVSVFAERVRDAWTVLEAAEAFDPEDPYARDAIGALDSTAHRIGVLSDERSSALLDAAAAAAYRAALDALAGLGYELEPVDDGPFLTAGDLLYNGPWIAERYVTFGSFLEKHLLDPGIDPTVAHIITKARDLKAVDAYVGAYELARLRRATDSTWSRVDVLAFPTTPTIPTIDDVEQDPFGANAQLGALTAFANLLDLCAVAVPGPARDDGLPAGVSVIAPAGGDARVAGVGARFLGEEFERIDGGGRVELAVVGAHLRGQPLNHELVELGARFVRQAHTSDGYRLYALANTAPPKPGLVRTTTGGAEITVEVWSLTPDAFGRFVAAVAPPLCIGTVELADGTTVKGFLSEVHAVADAVDITGYGGWITYLEQRA
jgi:allophanate hydrolase